MSFFLSPEPCRGGIHRGGVHVHAADGVPGQQDQHPDYVQRSEAPDPGCDTAAVFRQPADRPAPQGDHSRQVPGSAERLHPPVAGQNQGRWSYQVTQTVPV